MGNPLSFDLGERVVAVVDGGLSRRRRRRASRSARRARSAGASARRPAIWRRPRRASIAGRIASRRMPTSSSPRSRRRPTSRSRSCGAS